MSKDNTRNVQHEDDDNTSVDDKLIVHALIAEPEDFNVDESTESPQKLVPPERKSSNTQDSTSCGAQTANCLKKCFMYLLSYIGLTGIVVLYSILGGIIFVHLEAGYEEQVQHKALTLRKNFLSFVDRHVNLTVHHREHYKNQTYNWTNVDEKLKEFQMDTYNLVAQDGWDGVDDLHADPKWTFAAGLLYAVTVITTIGYGFITPKTIPGQAVTMLYALIGIPLTFLCLSNIGKAMAALVRSLYGGTFCVECRQKFCLTRSARRNVGDTGTRIELNELGKGRKLSDGEIDVPHSHDLTEVPIIVCLVLVIWYIVFGAIMFTIWEKDWDLFKGAYFCFITLSTIGFGDIVPGFSHKDWDDQVKQVACTLYLLIGLSTLAMCFELIQQRGISLANKVAHFIGLLKSNE